MGIIETIKMLTLEEGEEKKAREFVKNLLQDTEFDVAKIAKLSGTSETFVRKIQQDLK